ncbi:MAG: hypothetical protein MZV70_16730 [Desulfobacterales bacterium]|nr:hypothetical protein [Desulfobacterales bacterium]
MRRVSRVTKTDGPEKWLVAARHRRRRCSFPDGRFGRNTRGRCAGLRPSRS